MTPQRIDEIARTLPAYVPSPERQRATGDAILSAVGTRPTGHRGIVWRLGAAFAFAFAFVATLAIGWFARAPVSSPRPTKSAVEPTDVRSKAVRSGLVTAVVSANPNAQYERTLRPAQEIVRMTDGTVEFHIEGSPDVAALIVQTADGEVKASAASFRVVADKKRLLAVVVSSGQVLVRSGNSSPVPIVAGGEWRATMESETRDASSPIRAAPPVTAVSKLRRRPAPAPAEAETSRVAPADASSPRALAGERDFVDGWSLLQAAQPGRAAALLARSCRQGGRTPLAEDACFWHAVALVRSDKPGAARAALAGFMAAWPSSSRVSEAEELLRRLPLHDRAEQRP